MVNITRGGGESRGMVDSQDRLEVVHAGVKQGLDHGEGEFRVLGTIDCILGLYGRKIIFSILGIGTAEQSTKENSKEQTPNEESGQKK